MTTYSDQEINRLLSNLTIDRWLQLGFTIDEYVKGRQTGALHDLYHEALVMDGPGDDDDDDGEDDDNDGDYENYHGQNHNQSDDQSDTDSISGNNEHEQTKEYRYHGYQPQTEMQGMVTSHERPQIRANARDYTTARTGMLATQQRPQTEEEQKEQQHLSPMPSATASFLASVLPPLASGAAPQGSFGGLQPPLGMFQSAAPSTSSLLGMPEGTHQLQLQQQQQQQQQQQHLVSNNILDPSYYSSQKQPRYQILPDSCLKSPTPKRTCFNRAFLDHQEGADTATSAAIGTDERKRKNAVASVVGGLGPAPFGAPFDDDDQSSCDDADHHPNSSQHDATVQGACDDNHEAHGEAITDIDQAGSEYTQATEVGLVDAGNPIHPHNHESNAPQPNPETTSANHDSECEGGDGDDAQEEDNGNGGSAVELGTRPEIAMEKLSLNSPPVKLIPTPEHETTTHKTLTPTPFNMSKSCDKDDSQRRVSLTIMEMQQTEKQGNQYRREIQPRPMIGKARCA